MTNEAQLVDLASRLTAEAAELAGIAAAEEGGAPPPVSQPPVLPPPVTPPAPEPVPTPQNPPPSPPPVTPPATGGLDQHLVDILHQTVVGENTDGWDSAANGYRVNWFKGASGIASQNTGHDSGEDLRGLRTTLAYQHYIGKGTDTQVDGFADRGLGIAKTEFAKGYDKSWAPEAFFALYHLTGDQAWLDAVHGLLQFQLSRIDPALGVAHGPKVASTAANAQTYPDAYRADAELQYAAFMVYGGHFFNDQKLIDAGMRGLQTVHDQAFVAKTGLYARMVQIVGGKPSIVDFQHKAGEQGQNVWALALASDIAGDSGLKQQATQLLDGLNKGPLHDTTNGAFFFKQLGDTGVVDNSYKEFARTATIGWAAKLLGNETLRAEMVACMQKLYWQTPEAGFPYRCTVDFKQFQAENWVTSEAINICDALILNAGAA